MMMFNLQTMKLLLQHEYVVLDVGHPSIRALTIVPALFIQVMYNRNMVLNSKLHVQFLLYLSIFLVQTSALHVATTTVVIFFLI